MTALLPGIAIGSAIAAPVGPIGLLCIRRTLHAGPSVGLAAGLGAALADAMCGLVVASGLALTGWFMSHAATVSAIGAALLIGLGLASLRLFVAAARGGTTGPDKAAAPGALVAMSRRSAFATTFLLTAANPAKIVSFVGVVAALGAANAT